jgi:hypothetical protein
MSLQRQFKKKLRPYLLKVLDDDESRLIETAYFADPKFLEQAEESERSLIQDYLERRLSKSATARFEEVYLVSSGLQAKVAKLAGTSVVRPAPPPSFAWKRIALAACLAALMFAAAGLFELRTTTLYLRPGVALGSSNAANTLTLSPMQNRARLVFELPGPTSAPMAFGLKIWTRGPHGQKAVVWTNPRSLLAHQGKRGGELAVVVDASLFSSGTYVAEIVGRNNESVGFYLFRVSRP